MKLLLTGPAGSGKTHRVLAGFRESLQSGRDGRIVLPTATLTEHLRHELVRDGLVFRARQVATLAKFVEHLAPEMKVVSREFFQLMVEESLRRLAIPGFEKVADLAGFHGSLAATILNLDAAGCTAVQLAKMRGSLAPSRDAVVRVWQDVEIQMSERSLVTRGAALREAARRVGAKQPPDDVWFDGFAQLSGPEIDFIDAVSAKANVTVTLAGESVRQDLKTTLLDRGFVEESLTAKRHPKTLVQVSESAEREVEEIARRILECARLGQPFREIGVIVRKPEKYRPLLRAAFERFGIPAHFYFSEPLPAHPAVHLFTNLVEALLSGWDHERVLELLRFIPNAGTSDALDEFAVKMRQSLPGRGLDPLMELAGAHLTPQRVLRSLLQIDGWRNERHTPEEWAARLGCLPSLFRPRHLSDQIYPEEAALYRSQAAGVKAFAKAMESAALWWVDASKTIDLDTFWHVARSIVRLSTLTPEARTSNVVHVISAWEARQWDLATVFVCGMVEKDFPAQNARDPFFPDAALRDLARHGIRAQTSQDKDEEEFALFEAVSARARNLLVLSYPRADSRGQRCLKSIFLAGREAEAAGPVVRPALPPAIAQWQQPSRIQAQDLLNVLSEKHARTSVTALESLLQCPFQFFANKTLRIAELPCRPEDRLDFLSQGNIAHEVLSEWFVSREEVEPLFRRVFAAECTKKNIQPGFRTSRLSRALLIALRQFTTDRQYPQNLKTQTEVKFELAVDGQLSISGRFDRIDELEDGRAIVIDYKFSNATTTKNRLEDETRMQGPLYVWAAEKQFGRIAAAMVYISLKGGEKPEYCGWGIVPGANLTKLIAIPSDWIPTALQRASHAAAEYRSGIIHPRPASQEPCRYCDYRDACRIEQPAAIPAAGS